MNKAVGTRPGGEVDTTKGAHPFSADRPIRSVSEDLLGRGNFASSLAGAVEGWTQRDSLVLALYGPWGSGKTSLKNLVLESLTIDGPGAITLVEFNPWQWSAQAQIAEAFFEQLGLALGRTDKTREGRKRAARWLEYAAYLKVGAAAVGGLRGLMVGLLGLLGVVGLAALAPALWLRAALAVVGGLALGLAGLLAWGGKVADSMAAAVTARAEARAREVSEVKAEVAGLLRELGKPVLVVMDDIDRLPPQEVRLLFQLLKANADFPNLVYLLLFEREVIEKSVETEQGVSGRDYLKKIVQVGFDLPQVEQARLEKILFASLDELLALEGVSERWDRQRWARLFVDGLRPFFENLRDVRRFSATLAFQVSLLRRLETLEVNPVDLIGIEVLRVFEPSVYRALPSAKAALTSHPRDGALFGNGDQNQRKGTIEALVERVETSHREAVIEILKELFPPAAWAFGGHSYTGSEEQWLRALRICHPDAFDRYFLLELSQRDISQGELDRLLSRAGNREAFVQDLLALRDRGLLEVTLERLEAYKQQIDLTHAVPLVTALFDIGDELSDEPDDFFGISPAMHAVRIIHWYLKQEPDARARAAILKEAVNSTSGVFLPVMKVSIEDSRDEREREPDTSLVEDEELVELRRLCVEKMRQAAESSRLRDHPRLKYLLFRWKEWATAEEVSTWVDGLIQSRDGLMDFLEKSLHRVRSVGTGQYLPEDRYEMRLKEIEEFIPVDVVSRRMANADLSDLSEEERQAVEAFERALQRRAEGRSDEDWDRL